MIFKSAVDWWFYLVVIGAAAVALLGVLPLFRTGHGTQITFAAGILLVAVGLPFWLLLSTTYRVDSRALHVRSGPFHWSIPLSEIQTARASRSAWSSPALSLERIEIRYGNDKSILVSPADRPGFLNAIGHKLDGDG